MALLGGVVVVTFTCNILSPSVVSKQSREPSPKVLARRQKLIKFFDEMDRAKSDSDIEAAVLRNSLDEKDAFVKSAYLIPVYHRRGEFSRIVDVVSKYPMCKNSNYFEFEDSIRRLRGEKAVVDLRKEALNENILGFSVKEQMVENDLDEDQIFPYMRAVYSKTGRDEAWKTLMSTFPKKIDVWMSYDYYLECLGRKSEIYPQYEEWYRRADAKQRAYIKSKITLDYKRLDNENKP